MGRSVVFSAFYADFCLCPKLVIITTLREQYMRQRDLTVFTGLSYNWSRGSCPGPISRLDLATRWRESVWYSPQVCKKNRHMRQYRRHRYSGILLLIFSSMRYELEHTIKCIWFSERVCELNTRRRKSKAKNSVSKSLPSHTVELRWLEHWWLVYHGCFELVLESLEKIP